MFCKKLARAVCALVVALFVPLVARVLFGDCGYDYSALILIACALAALAALVGLSRLFAAREGALSRRYPAILIVFLTAMGALQLFNAAELRFTPAFDMAAIYDGAIEWLESGTFASYAEYYGYFPNNLGAMALLRIWFGAARFIGCTDYFMAGALLNCLFSLATMALTAYAALKCAGVRASLGGLAMFALNGAFYVIAPAFYTDALSMPFPILAYCCYLRYKDGARRFALYAGAAIAVGALIKFTVAIALIAIAMDSALTRGLKKSAALAVIMCALLGAGLWGLNSFYYMYHLDSEAARINNTPRLHWVMMGLKGSGGYNPGDYDFTRSLAPEGRNEALLQEIGARLEALGPAGLANLLSRKTAYDFGDGTLALSDFLDDGPVNDSPLHYWLLYSGEGYAVYRYICTGMLLAIYALMIAAAGRDFSRRARSADCLAPRLCAIGILLFLAFWETSGRYFANFLPMIALSAALSFSSKGGARKCTVQR